VLQLEVIIDIMTKNKEICLIPVSAAGPVRSYLAKYYHLGMIRCMGDIVCTIWPKPSCWTVTFTAPPQKHLEENQYEC